MKTMKQKDTQATKTSLTIAEFEKWITPHLLEGKLLDDVILAYLKSYPGRPVELVRELYVALEAQEATDGSN